ncbi:hypothetical protein [Streptomyces sp. NPDC059788]|uniref:hypothetical protein n=1 Tax=Streptomyces sp. NPDC059788 TaxID=3346948 RepID=UPI0036583CC6
MTTAEPCKASGRTCGTPAGWRKGGRCPRCRKAHNEDTARYRRQRTAPDPALLDHIATRIAQGEDLPPVARELGLYPRSVRAAAADHPRLAAALANTEQERAGQHELKDVVAYLLTLTEPRTGAGPQQTPDELALWRTTPGFTELERRMMQKTWKPRRKRTVVELTAFGETKPALTWGRDPRAAVEGQTIKARYLAGMTAEEAITSPPGTRMPRAEEESCPAGSFCGTLNGPQYGGSCPRCREAVAVKERSRRRPPPDGDTAAVIAAYQAGEPIKSIVETFGLSAKELSRLARKYQARRSPAAGPQEQKEAAVARQQERVLHIMRSGDVSLSAAARQLGLKAGRVVAWSQRDQDFAARAKEAADQGTQAAKERFLSALSAGRPLEQTRREAGVTWYRCEAWCRSDPDFADRFRQVHPWPSVREGRKKP